MLEKSDKKALKRFYRQQNYSAAFMGYDQCYVVKEGKNIIAAAIVSMITRENNQALLHGLVVSKTLQKQGVASNLLSHITKHHTELYCFASVTLQAFYLHQQFTQVSTSVLKDTLESRLNIYRQKKPDLVIFNYHSPVITD
ncbi:GNAT family N-acetyltransferase [Colwelliaceae bacterium 6471]